MKGISIGLAISLAAAGMTLTLPQAIAADVDFSNLDIGKVTPGSGHIGLDIWWSDAAGRLYNPCHHSDDMYYGACIMSNVGKVSYYKVFNYGPNGSNYPYGMFIDNKNSNYCTSETWCTGTPGATINHGWARLVTGAAVEIYPYNAAGQYDPSTSGVGGLRIEVQSFDRFANAGRYSPAIGDVELPREGSPGVGKLNGFIRRNGIPVGQDEASLDIFQNGATTRTSKGYPASGFSSVSVNKDGYYNLGALPNGSYHLYVNDRVNSKTVEFNGVAISTNYERLDFDLADPCFGHAGCSGSP